ncbi:NUDIX domain-containing protein [Paenarthrobacter sp. DKR-5]|uniref:NUDIX hydrolase n=1 Tax=Paenarthrobacter sp. DKR-5 TaxID=2835535 RepID=UPI001BDD48F4|nr:NUDIX domain-containing protein [Paenarthrobacter sp. DKR-5]MBT1002400.1 NUDIX domain-containing protein [Paenarthrobacter sp. DKR-5]
MPTPDFVLELRRKVGHDLLWLPGVTAVVLDDAGRVLLGQRADNGRWTLITGMLEPGEQPAVGMLREVYEETAVVAEVLHLVSVNSQEPMKFPNGDRAQFLDLTFLCRHVSGDARVNDDESLAVGWFAPEDLPDLPPSHLHTLRRALASDGVPHFARPE